MFGTMSSITESRPVFTVLTMSSKLLFLSTEIFFSLMDKENNQNVTCKSFTYLECFDFLLQVTIGFAIFTYAPPAYGGYEYPPWAVNLGWMIAASSLVPIPIVINIYSLFPPSSGEHT